MCNLVQLVVILHVLSVTELPQTTVMFVLTPHTTSSMGLAYQFVLRATRISALLLRSFRAFSTLRKYAFSNVLLASTATLRQMCVLLVTETA